MTTNIDKYLTDPDHGGIDHTGLTGVGDLSTAAHAALDHTGIPGVPVAEAFTAGVHAGTDHAGLTGVGDLTTAAHALIDHSAIPGVGGSVNANFTVLDVGSTAAQINTALSTYRVVYLKPGNYGVMSAQITMPVDSALICLSAGPCGGTAGALFQYNSNITAISMGGRNTISGLSFLGTFAGSAALVNVGGSAGYCVIKNCTFNMQNWTGRLVSSELGCALHMENVSMENVERTGSEPAIKNRPSVGDPSAPAYFSNVRVKFETSGASTRIGILTQEAATFINCYVTHAGSHGFQFSETFTTTLISCVANNCGGNGFEHSNPGQWVSLMGCNAYLNTGKGFNLPFGSAKIIGSIFGCVAQTNTGGNTVQTGYHNSANAFI